MRALEDLPRFSYIANKYLKYSRALEQCKEPKHVHFDADLSTSHVFNVSLSDSIPVHTHLTKIDLVTLEVADTVSSNGRNREQRQICWNNLGDTTLYTAECHVGSFDINGMVTEILRALNAVMDTKSGRLHQWYVSYTAAPTNGIRFHNVVFQALSPDPIACRAGSAVMTISCTAHGMSVDDFVTFQNVQNNPGGLSNDMFNNISFVVATVVDADHFTIVHPSVAYADNNVAVGDAGGAGVLLGTGRDFAFTTRLSNDSALRLIGFPLLSGMNVAQRYGLTADKFNAQFITLPSQMLQEHPDLSPRTLVEVTGAPQRMYRVTEDGKAMTAWPPGTDNQTTDLNDRDNQRVYFNSPPSFSFRKEQSNVFDSGSLYASINLAGETYCFLTEVTTGKKFAKIQLRAGSGFIDYNTFFTTMFTTAELQTLHSKQSLRFVLQTPEGNIMFTKGVRMSGTIAVHAEPIIPSILLRIVERPN